MCLQLHVGVGVGKHLNEVLSIRAQEFLHIGPRVRHVFHLNEVLSIRAQEFSNRARIGTRLRHLNEVLSIRAQECGCGLRVELTSCSPQ